jgi:hypothetical protein
VIENYANAEKTELPTNTLIVPRLNWD